MGAKVSTAPAAPFRVRYGDGASDFQRVRLTRSMSPADVERAVAGAVGLEQGMMFLRNEDGVSGFHAELAGDWEVGRLLGAGRSEDLLVAVRQLGDRFDAVGDRLGGRIDAMGEQLGGRIDALGGRIDKMSEDLGGRIDTMSEKLVQLGAAVIGVRQRLSPPRDEGRADTERADAGRADAGRADAGGTILSLSDD